VSHDHVEAGVCLLLGQLLLLDQAGELARRDVFDLVNCVVYEFLVDVLDDDGGVRRGDCLCDLATHGASADNGGFVYEHEVLDPPGGRVLKPVLKPFARS